MATSTTTMPPTTHTLPYAQRLRLMRSTRKIGALLGETPLLVERRSGPASPTTAAFTLGHARSASTMSTESKRSGRLFLAAHAPHSSSLALSAAPPVTTNNAHAHLPPVARPTLFLRLQPAASASSPAERTPLPSPLSPTFNLNSPATPAPAADACRRRKMAKLLRTLGENVPPELVFPATPMPRARRRASTLTSSVPEFVLERRRGGLPAAVAAEEEEAPRPSFNADEPFSFPSTVPFAPSPEPRASSDTSASGASGSSGASAEPLVPHAESGMHRREQGWSGEWRGRVGNMDDVVRSLRGLKGK